MPIVVTRRVYPDLPAARVWTAVRDIAAYASFMQHVLAIDVVEDAGGRLVTNWTVLFNGNELRWTEIDLIDDVARRIRFDQTEGDLEVWRGQVDVTASGGGCEVTYTVEFDLGIPALADLLHPLGRKAVDENCRQMLKAIAQSVGEEAVL